MDKLRNTILIASLVLLGLTIPARAEMATMDEALTVANNWINLIVQKTGSWGDANTAFVEDIQEFKRGNRTLGYFCRVKPKGYIVLSLHKQLAPVKAYSATCDLDPESEVGMAELLKDCMERIHNWINEWGTRMNASPDEVMAVIPEINYRDSWDRLNVDAMSFQQELDSEVETMNYQGGDVLLSTSWHQGDPYNSLCPTGDTTCPDCCPGDPWVCNPSDPTVVGCVATAGAQIMKYWNWPPYGVSSNSYSWDGDDSCPAGGNPGAGAGTLSATFSDTYNWRRIANRYVWDAGQNRWEDENGDPVTQAHLDAVAELCYEVGVAVEMDYGGCGSGVPTYDMEAVYENQYRYATACAIQNRPDYDTPADWFSLIQGELNANRPLQYRIEGHSIVCDGWQIVGTDNEYHMNYGWDWTCNDRNGCNTWYALDALHQPGGGDTNDEYVLENIYPAQSLHSLLSGIYTRRSFPYRYFNVDATGTSATFAAGQYLQFLPDITVTCTSTAGGYIRFYGYDPSLYHTRLFTRGDTSRGVRIYNGGIRLYQNGSIRFE